MDPMSNEQVGSQVGSSEVQLDLRVFESLFTLKPVGSWKPLKSTALAPSRPPLSCPQGELNFS